MLTNIGSQPRQKSGTRQTSARTSGEYLNWAPGPNRRHVQQCTCRDVVSLELEPDNHKRLVGVQSSPCMFPFPLPFGGPFGLLAVAVAILLLIVAVRIAVGLAWRLAVVAAVVLGVLWLLNAAGINVPGPTPF